MRIVTFYTAVSGEKPIEEFLDSLTAKESQKIAWVLKIVREQPMVSREYLKNSLALTEYGRFGYHMARKSFACLGSFTKGIW